MTEPAKQAAYPILREYVNTSGWSAPDIKSAATHIGNIIDAKFAEVIKKADERNGYEAHLLTAQKQREVALVERDVIREERDALQQQLDKFVIDETLLQKVCGENSALKKALAELVFVVEQIQNPNVAQGIVDQTGANAC